MSTEGIRRAARRERGTRGPMDGGDHGAERAEAPTALEQAAIETASVFAEGIADTGSHLGNMVGAVAGTALGIKHESQKGSREKEKEKKASEKQEQAPDHTEEPPMSREEFFECFSQFLEDEDFDAAKGFFEKRHVAYDELKGVSNKILKLLKKRQHAEAHNLLKQVFEKGEEMVEEE